jgi:hypothetical protein
MEKIIDPATGRMRHRRNKNFVYWEEHDSVNNKTRFSRNVLWCKNCNRHTTGANPSYLMSRCCAPKECDSCRLVIRDFPFKTEFAVYCETCAYFLNLMENGGIEEQRYINDKHPEPCDYFPYPDEFQLSIAYNVDLDHVEAGTIDDFHWELLFALMYDERSGDDWYDVPEASETEVDDLPEDILEKVYGANFTKEEQLYAAETIKPTVKMPKEKSYTINPRYTEEEKAIIIKNHPIIPGADKMIARMVSEGKRYSEAKRIMFIGPYNTEVFGELTDEVPKHIQEIIKMKYSQIDQFAQVLDIVYIVIAKLPNPSYFAEHSSMDPLFDYTANLAAPVSSILMNYYVNFFAEGNYNKGIPRIKEELEWLKIQTVLPEPTNMYDGDFYKDYRTPKYNSPNPAINKLFLAERNLQIRRERAVWLFRYEFDTDMSDNSSNHMYNYRREVYSYGKKELGELVFVRDKMIGLYNAGIYKMDLMKCKRRGEDLGLMAELDDFSFKVYKDMRRVQDEWDSKSAIKIEPIRNNLEDAQYKGDIFRGVMMSNEVKNLYSEKNYNAKRFFAEIWEFETEPLCMGNLVNPSTFLLPSMMDPFFDFRATVAAPVFSRISKSLDKCSGVSNSPKNLPDDDDDSPSSAASCHMIKTAQFNKEDSVHVGIIDVCFKNVSETTVLNNIAYKLMNEEFSEEIYYAEFFESGSTFDVVKLKKLLYSRALPNYLRINFYIESTKKRNEREVKEFIEMMENRAIKLLRGVMLLSLFHDFDIGSKRKKKPDIPKMTPCFGCSAEGYFNRAAQQWSMAGQLLTVAPVLASAIKVPHIFGCSNVGRLNRTARQSQLLRCVVRIGRLSYKRRVIGLCTGVVKLAVQRSSQFAIDCRCVSRCILAAFFIFVFGIFYFYFFVPAVKQLNCQKLPKTLLGRMELLDHAFHDYYVNEVVSDLT